LAFGNQESVIKQKQIAESMLVANGQRVTVWNTLPAHLCKPHLFPDCTVGMGPGLSPCQGLTIFEFLSADC